MRKNFLENNDRHNDIIQKRARNKMKGGLLSFIGLAIFFVGLMLALNHGMSSLVFVLTFTAGCVFGGGIIKMENS